MPKCPPRWLQPSNSPRVEASTLPTSHSLHSSHRPTHPPEALCTDPQLTGTFHLHLRLRAPSLWCRLRVLLSNSILLLPVGLGRFPRGRQSVLGPQALSVEAGTEIQERDEGALIRESPKNPPRKKHAQLHLHHTPVPLTHSLQLRPH